MQTRKSLERVLGKHSTVASAIIGARDMMIEGLQSDLAGLRVDPACPRLRQYLIMSMGALPDEVLRILFVDPAGYLLADEQLQSGTLGHVAIYPRTIFRRAMELNAAGLLLVHNHPSGDPTPSEGDVVVTRKLIEIGRPLDVEVIEHIVVAATCSCSILGKPRGSRQNRAAVMPTLRSRPGGEPGEELSDVSTALENAMRTARRRMLRRQLIGSPELFGEPAWDMLIDLFIHQCQDTEVSTSALGIGSGMPSSTGLRLVQKLCEANLIEKFADPCDARRQFVRLTPDLAWRMRVYFSADEENSDEHCADGVTVR